METANVSATGEPGVRTSPSESEQMLNLVARPDLRRGRA